MTVAEIKEFIDEWKEYYKSYALIGKGEVDKTLDEIKGLLDDLEPKAKWEETDLWEDGIGDIMKCSNCGHNHLDNMNYCSSCGARMEVEE